MCTLIVLHRCVPGRPLVVAANRDEFFARPAEGPAIREGRAGRILAPRDLEAGGTWLGLNDRGVFVGLTNLRPEKPDPLDPDGPARATPGLRSRGEVVLSALEARSAAEAVQALGDLEEGAYNPFQLLVADERQARLVIYRARPEIVALLPGVHVVGNVEERMDEGADPTPPESRMRKLTRVRRRVERMMTQPDRDLLEGLAGICREHVAADGAQAPRSQAARGSTSFESTCVHAGETYGTRSSLLLELAGKPEASRLWGTDGAPCERPYEDLSPLLRALDVRSGPAAEAETEARTKR